MGYISSNQNRFYAAVESSYGVAQQVTSNNRFPATHVRVSRVAELVRRLGKTGTRTYGGTTPTGRFRTAFDIKSYLSVWNGSGEPGYGPLFEAACGATPLVWPGIIIDSVVNSTQMACSVPHGLLVGSAVSWNNEIRFVTDVLSPYSFTINVGFSSNPGSGALLGPTVTYRLADLLPSVTLYDYWDSTSQISRAVSGCAVDRMEIAINGDYHEFSFTGPGSDILDAMPLSSGSSASDLGLEPALTAFNGSAVAGHLGQAWLGTPASQFLTLTEATVQLRNNLDLRRNEFGLIQPAGVVAGDRSVSSTFSVFVQDDERTRNLYRLAKTRQPFAAMLQLGTQQGQLMGIYLPQVLAEVPNYNDSSTRLAWDFQNVVAQGAKDDELVIAFA